MTTYTDIFSTMNWQDGQEVRRDFLNNGQRFLRAQMTDQIVQQSIGAVAVGSTNQPDIGGADGTDAPSLWAYCASPGRAYLRQGSANNKIQLAPGTLFQKVATADGNDSTLVPFNFTGIEEWTLADGDVTNPRVDLLQMSLSYITDTPASLDFQDAVTRIMTTNPTANTRRRVQANLTVKQGTPAASPRIPDPDSGFVPVGTVVVGNGWTSAATPTFGIDQGSSGTAVVSDQRMPVGISAHLVTAGQVFPINNWTISSDQRQVSASNATNSMHVPYRGRMGRLVGVRINHGSVFTGVTLGSTGLLSVGYTRANTLTSALALVSQLFSRSTFEAAHNPASGPTILPSLVNGIGMPLWQNGGRAPIGVSGGILFGFEVLAVAFGNDTNGQIISGVTFYIAG